MRDRFILGAGTHIVGQTGGIEEVVLSLEQMPNHDHIVYVAPDGSGFSSRPRQTTGGGQVTTRTTASGNSKPHPNMPPYYTLCYIMKL